MLEGAVKQKHDLFCCGEKMDVRIVYDFDNKIETLSIKCTSCHISYSESKSLSDQKVTNR
jgi:hypothetical protein